MLLLLLPLQGFTSSCIWFVLLESNRIEYHGGTTAEQGTALCFLKPIWNSLDFCSALHPKKTVSIIFKDFLCLSRRSFSKFKDNSRKKLHFLEFQEFSRTKVNSRTFQGLCEPWVTSQSMLSANSFINHALWRCTPSIKEKFHDFLFIPHTGWHSHFKIGSTLKIRICSYGSKFFIKSWSHLRREASMLTKELLAMEVYCTYWT